MQRSELTASSRGRPLRRIWDGRFRIRRKGNNNNDVIIHVNPSKLETRNPQFTSFSIRYPNIAIDKVCSRLLSVRYRSLYQTNSRLCCSNYFLFTRFWLTKHRFNEYSEHANNQSNDISEKAGRRFNNSITFTEVETIERTKRTAWLRLGRE